MNRENLTKARKKHHYTQETIADKLGITARHYQALEAGTSKGSVDVWEKLKVILHAKSIDWLLKQSGGISQQNDTTK